MRTSRIAAQVAAVLCLATIPAGVSRAHCIASPSNSSKPTCIALVGMTGGIPDAGGQFTVTLRDLANNVMANSDVMLDFSQCPDLRIASAQPWGNLTVDCTNHQVHGTTDSQGQATFRILGSAVNSGASPGAGLGCVRIYGGCATLLGYITAQAYDQDGQGGVNGNDLALLLDDLFSGTYFGRSDYDCSHTLSGNDLSLWLTAFFRDGSTASASPLCSP